jgi:hypothetical protein
MLERLLIIQHRFNPLHVYCRLVDKGFNKAISISICRYYEVLVYSWLGRFSIFGVQACRVLRFVN